LLLARVVGIEHIPARESERIQNGRNQWLAIREEAGLRIDPETAEVRWNYRQTLDPYGIGLYVPEEFESIGREYFARSPGSDIWVWFNDLPDAVYDRLWERLRLGDVKNDDDWLL
jgi:hypothetical protein